jgi:predicted Holliday junction resolvase-like endonuclease
MWILYLIITLLLAINIFLIYLLITKIKREKEIRKEAIEKSRLVLEGKFKEQLAPFLPEFGFNPTDARFIGSPVDFIIFDGAAENNIKKIVFLEVKSGKSRLTKKEEQIKENIEKGKVEFKELKLDF